MLKWLTPLKWASVPRKLTRRKNVLPHHPLQSKSFGIIRFLFSRLKLFLGRSCGLPDPGAIPIEHGQPLPFTSFSCMCTHYTAVCCCNAPINFPFDILRAIYKSRHLSFVPALLLGNNAAVLHSW